jgi:hypothetical protein
VLVLLDACHSGHLSQDLVVRNDDLASALVRNDRAGVVVFAAAKGRQFSYEPRGSRALVLTDEARELVQPRGKEHGFFTGAFLDALDSAESDRNGDGAIQLGEIIDEVTRRVGEATSMKQTPWVARREIFGDFALAPTPAATPPAAVPAASP